MVEDALPDAFEEAALFGATVDRGQCPAVGDDCGLVRGRPCGAGHNASPFLSFADPVNGARQ